MTAEGMGAFKKKNLRQAVKRDPGQPGCRYHETVIGLGISRRLKG